MAVGQSSLAPKWFALVNGKDWNLLSGVLILTHIHGCRWETFCIFA